MNKTSKMQTGELVKDFVSYRLNKAGYEDWTGGSQQHELIINSTTSISTAQRVLRIMGDEFSNAYFNAFDEMTNSINVHDDDLKNVLYQILDVTCETGIEWGRIVGIFVFSAALAVKAMDCNRTTVVENIVLWTTEYLEEQRFSSWIKQHGGWDGFAQFYNNPKARRQDINQQFWAQAYNVSVGVFTKVASLANFLMQ